MPTLHLRHSDSGPDASELIDLTIDALATYRLTRLVVEDAITEPLRNKVWERFDASETKIGYLFTCPWCVSIWAGAAVVAARQVAPQAWSPVAKVLVASALTGLIAARL